MLKCQAVMQRIIMSTQEKATQTQEPIIEEVETPYVEPTKDELDKLIRHHVWTAMAVGLVPIPIVDLAGILGIQLNLLRKLAKRYRVPFLKDSVKNILSSLVGSAMPVTLAAPLASFAKAIPVVGYSVGAISMPLMAGAATYAIGKVFIQHFASGGTFLTFDPNKVKAYYEEMFQEGKNIASEMKKEKEKKA